MTDLPLSPARLFQVKMEREQHQTEIRDLQDQLSEMHDELDSTKRSEDREKAALIEVREPQARCWPHLPQRVGLHGPDAISHFLLCVLIHWFLHLDSVRPS